MRLFVRYRLQKKKKMYIQGVNNVRAHFKKVITLIIFAVEIISKKNLKKVNQYF